MARRWLTRSWPNMSRSLDAFFETQGNAQGEEGRGPLADEDPPPVGPLGAALLLLPGHTPAQKSDSHTGGAGGVGHLRGDSEFGQLRDHGFPCGSTAVPLCLCPKTCQVKSRGEQNMGSCGIEPGPHGSDRAGGCAGQRLGARGKRWNRALGREEFTLADG